MRRSELIRELLRFPGEDPEIVTHGDDGNACTDVHVESLDDPWLRKINEADGAIFIRGYGPGDL